MTSPVSPRAPFSEMTVLPEDVEIFKGFEKCLNLRDIYLAASFQRSTDNPANDTITPWRPDPPVLLSAADALSFQSMTSTHQTTILDTLHTNPLNQARHFDDARSSVSLNNFNGSITGSMSESINISKTYQLALYDLDACRIPNKSSFCFKFCEDGVFRVFQAPSGKNTFPMCSVVSILLCRC
jgi:hypothetical protein